MGCSELIDKFTQKCSDGFQRYGQFVGRHPWAVLIGCVVVNCSLGLLLIDIQSVNDVEDVYVPIGNQAAKDRQAAKRLFPDDSGRAFYPQHLTDDGKFGEIIVRRVDISNILTDPSLDEIANIVEMIKEFSFRSSDNNTFVDFQTSCARQMGRCVVDGEFILGESFRRDLLAHNVSYTEYDRGIPGFRPVDLSSYLTEVTLVNGSLESAKYLKIRFSLRQDSSQNNALSGQWEDTFLKEMLKVVENTTLIEISYAVSDSLNVELDENTGGDVMWFSLTFTLMITYASLVTSGGNCVSTKGHLSTAGVLAAGLGILSGFGIASRIYPFTNIVGVMPFLVLGVGVDDTFILISGWTESRLTEIPERLGATMRTSGMSVTLTSLTDVVAFLIGIQSSFQGVKIFCLYTALAIFFCYLNQVTMFAACLAIHGRRVEDYRHCVTCMEVKSEAEIKRDEHNEKMLVRFFFDAKRFFTSLNISVSSEVSDFTMIIHDNEDAMVEEVRNSLSSKQFWGSQDRNRVSARLSRDVTIIYNQDTHCYTFQLSEKRAKSVGKTLTLSVSGADNIYRTTVFIFTHEVAAKIEQSRQFTVLIPLYKPSDRYEEDNLPADMEKDVSSRKLFRFCINSIGESGGEQNRCVFVPSTPCLNSPASPEQVVVQSCSVSPAPSTGSKEKMSSPTDTQKLPLAVRLQIWFCSGEPSQKLDDDGNCFQWAPRKILPFVVKSLPGKLFVVLLFLGYLAASIYGALQLQQGLDLKNLIAPSSYFYKYTNWNADHFQTRFLITFFVNQPLAYNEEANINHLETLFEEIKADGEIKSDFPISWLNAYQNSSFYDRSTKSKFISGLKTFLLYNPLFENDVQFGDNSSEITSSRFHFFTTDIPTSSGQGQMMIRMRTIAARSSISLFAYSPPFIYFEQYNAILSNTLQTVGVAVAAMFVLSIIFIPQPLMFISITVSMASTLTGIFGFMYWWDLTLSSITMIHLVMSTGFSVDYSAHICHAIMHSAKSGSGRNDIVSKALAATGGPILNGAMSSIIGILFLLPSESYIFRSFFKVMLLVVAFGIAHSILFLPVFFALFGPKGRPVPEEERNTGSGTKLSQVGDNPRQPSPAGMEMQTSVIHRD